MNSIILKPERDKHVRNKHPWVFMGAIKEYPEFENGDILKVVTDSGQFVGYGYFNKGQSISGRMFSFADESVDPEDAFVQNIKSAIALRKNALSAQADETNAYRLVNGEGDNLPGLIVDRYNKVLVIQINTLGIEKLKPLILKTLQEETGLNLIYEKSSTQTRRKEGLQEFEGWLVGETEQPFEILEHGLKFNVSVTGMQKTGFFLDQREMRQLVKTLAKDKTVLNCFSYTAGFSVYASAGGAKKVDTVDLSELAIEGAKENMALNGFGGEENGFYAQDVLSYFRDNRDSEYDFIILDPPAFAKKASDVANASRGYRDINRAALEKLPVGGLLLTSSCSSHVDADMFQTIVFQA
ncbi:MAG TPA: class I SAM-dependent rRNA methyltransferase, partial [Patescibacteria group bacterium]|nr:class I SAM-dependent rRNA methyltransferase [Patescibacteria group bacterium]